MISETNLKQGETPEMKTYMKTFNDIIKFNWAWIYKNTKTDEWTQFECLVCMILESKYQLFKKNNQSWIDKSPSNQVGELVNRQVRGVKFEVIK